MSRTVTLTEKEIQIRLYGLTSIAAMKRKLHIPYPSIISVETHGPNIHSLMRLGGTAIGGAHHGEFYGDGWYFLSYEHSDKVIFIQLRSYEDTGRVYKGMVFGVDDPEDIKAQIDSRMHG
jgi:hypothetical protein